MEKAAVKLTVYFEEPFWYGIYELRDDERLWAARIVFGAEPKIYEVYAFYLANWNRISFDRSVAVEKNQEKCLNPKRRMRLAKKETAGRGAGTKAQQAIKLSQEEGKKARKQLSRSEREREKERLFLIKQQKRKEKHRGR